MNTSFVISPDGTRIAYDVTGEGSAIILLHGGWHTRQNWHDVGYVQRLKDVVHPLNETQGKNKINCVQEGVQDGPDKKKL